MPWWLVNTVTKTCNRVTSKKQSVHNSPKQTSFSNDKNCIMCTENRPTPNQLVQNLTMTTLMCCKVSQNNSIGTTVLLVSDRERELAYSESHRAILSEKRYQLEPCIGAQMWIETVSVLYPMEASLRQNTPIWNHLPNLGAWCSITWEIF